MPLGGVGGWCGLKGDPGNMAFVLVWGLGKRNYESGWAARRGRAEEQRVGGKGTERQGGCKASGGLGRWQPRPRVVAAEGRGSPGEVRVTGTVKPFKWDMAHLQAMENGIMISESVS